MIKTVKVKVGKFVRNVAIDVHSPNYFTGYVGKAYFCWRSDLYDLPYVKIKGRGADDRTRRLVRLFIEEYKRMLLKNKKSPLHFNKSEAASSVSNRKQPTISGVPHWMREEHKVWTKCHRKDGSFYLRRTRFKEESREIVEKYLPYCQGCMLRVNCREPCKEPDLMCQTEEYLDTQKDSSEVTVSSGGASGRLDVYIDGNSVNGKYSWAYVVIYNGDTIIYKDYGIGTNAAAAIMYSVAGELAAAMRAVKWAATNKKEIVIHHHYQGVSSWVDGTWETKNEFTQAYRNFMAPYKSIVKFNKVTSHTGINKGNELADKLAKKALGI